MTGERIGLILLCSIVDMCQVNIVFLPLPLSFLLNVIVHNLAPLYKPILIPACHSLLCTLDVLAGRESLLVSLDDEQSLDSGWF